MKLVPLLCLLIVAVSLPVMASEVTVLSPGVNAERGIVFGSSPSQEDGKPIDLLLDAYWPQDSTKSNGAAFVYVHGNPGKEPYPGERLVYDPNPEKEIVSRGYACFNVAYQFFGEDEVKTAIRFVRANAKRFNIDPDRIVAIGHSLGGSHAVTLDVTDDSTGMTPLKEDPRNNATVSAKVAAGICLAGGTFYPDAFDSTDGPILFIQGTEDKINSPHWLDQIVAASRKIGHPCPAYWINGVGHDIDIMNHKCDGRTLLDLVDQFTRAHVLNEPSCEMASIAIQVDGEGSVKCDPPYEMYTKGTSVTVKATPSDGMEFAGWEGDKTGENDTLTVVMDANKHIKAIFRPKKS